MNEFGPAFAGADAVVLTDIYSAGEDPIPGVNTDTLATAVRDTFRGELHVATTLNDVPRELARLARRGDLIVLLGAGSIASIWRSVLGELQGAGRN